MGDNNIDNNHPFFLQHKTNNLAETVQHIFKAGGGGGGGGGAQVQYHLCYEMMPTGMPNHKQEHPEDSADQCIFYLTSNPKLTGNLKFIRPTAKSKTCRNVKMF